MTSQHRDSTSAADQAGRPIATWVLMAVALAATLLMPDWSGSGIPRSPWLLAAPAVLGLAGALLAARNNRPGWMVASGIWGVALVPGLITVVTLVSGP
ncbi:hypothetical protein [Paeniglutamicibacter sp. NPDC091659]|uniref:hypothetical protein n=1 Tax=Paeniglutamicibacter sp. NPDC091659 TaxID=3364389 RepID=UPI0037F36DC8